jgi:hypothetical protein
MRVSCTGQNDSIPHDCECEAPWAAIVSIPCNTISGSFMDSGQRSEICATVENRGEGDGNIVFPGPYRVGNVSLGCLPARFLFCLARNFGEILAVGIFPIPSGVFRLIGMAHVAAGLCDNAEAGTKVSSYWARYTRFGRPKKPFLMFLQHCQSCDPAISEASFGSP